MNRKLLLFGAFVIASLYASAQNYRYHLQLTDKNGCEYSLKHPEKFLSEKALQRRSRQGLEVDSTDLPIPGAYLKTIEEQGVRIHSKSKWTNTVLVDVTDTLTGKNLVNLPFVSESTLVWINPSKNSKSNHDRKKQVTNGGKTSDSEYGDAYLQCSMMNGNTLHYAGFRGEGMTIAVIDGGFFNADVINAFDQSRILGTKDFVNPESDIYAEDSHGMKVLSCMFANRPNIMMGTATGASFWLLRSEDADSEQPVENDYWAAALEFADSVGVDVVNSSLGYNDYDEPFADAKYWELDGKTYVSSRAASMAADKGMIVCLSAGNSGDSPWKKITPPADAFDVLTVGAVTYARTNTNFSSLGNTSDGRVKPDVCAMGAFSTVMGTNGVPQKGSGTSYASPILCGLVACLWQALPQFTAHELMDLIRRKGHNAAHPDNVYGYGIPDFWRAYQEGKNL